MSTERLIARLPMRPVVGYGGDTHSAARLERAFDPDETSGRVCALRIPFKGETGPAKLDGVNAISLPGTGIGSTDLAAVDGDRREAIGGAFFLYVHPKGLLRVGPRALSNTLRPECYLMSHGVVMIRRKIIVHALEPEWLAEKLPGNVLLMLGRTASNHDRLIFTRQATTLVTRLLRNTGYDKIDIEIDYQARD